MINSLRTILATTAACGLLFASSALAAPKDYQFTGSVTAMDDTSFTVMKGKETWSFAKDGETKLPEGAKVGDKVTVHYMMHATTVDASAAPAAKEKTTKGKKADAAAMKPVGASKGNDKAAAATKAPDATAPAADATTAAPATTAPATAPTPVP